MNINGIGMVFNRGQGIDVLQEALERGWVPPDDSTGSPVYRVSAEDLKHKTVGRKIRRADRFGKMAVIAAIDAFANSGIDVKDFSRVGILLATAFGPQVTTFSFLDDIIEYGDEAVSPTTFSHSVHNAAASYIASTLGVRGPTLTLTKFNFAFHDAISLADAWLKEGRCDHVLVGVADECGTVMEHIAAQKLNIANEGRIEPLTLGSAPVAVPGEGSVFFVLSNRACDNNYGSINAEGVDMPAEVADLQVLDSNGMIFDESVYLKNISAASPVAAYAPLFGSIMTGNAFDCAVAALMIKKQCVYASPVTDNPHNLHVSTETIQSDLKSISCIGCDCSGRRSTIRIEGRDL